MEKKHPKMDRYLININQPYEIAWVIKRMAKIGRVVTSDEVKRAVKSVGVGRQKVYTFLNEF